MDTDKNTVIIMGDTIIYENIEVSEKKPVEPLTGK